MSLPFITEDQYIKIKSIFTYIFVLFVIIFFVNEFSYILSFTTFLNRIPDFFFLILFSLYLVVDFLPIVKPEWFPQSRPDFLQENNEEEKDNSEAEHSNEPEVI